MLHVFQKVVELVLVLNILVANFLEKVDMQ